MNITWIASYPKSGNTWMRFMLYASLFATPTNPIEVSRRIPDIHRPLPFDPPSDGNLYAKTHFKLSQKHPKLNESSRAIHIIRNPRDVLLSAINYREITATPGSPFPREQYAKGFIANMGDPGWHHNGFGNWIEHARSWMNTDQFPVHTVRYEDLRSAPAQELTKILGFLGISKSEGEIQSAINASSFEQMRALEIREKHNAKDLDQNRRLFVGSRGAANKGRYFMNKGRSGQSLDSIGEGFDELFNASFADELAELGY